MNAASTPYDLVLVWRGYRRATTLPSRWGAK